MKVTAFTEGKIPEKNEDSNGFNETTIVLADGATDKTGKSYDGKSGGEILSKLILKETLESDLNGVELVNFLTDKTNKLYQEINPEGLTDDFYKFCTTLVCARIDGDKLKVTQVGDSTFRINGTDLHQNPNLIDILTSEARSHFINLTGNIEQGREFILPILKKLYEYRNNEESAAGYGGIDGQKVPEKFIKYFEFELKDIKTLELISDGYFDIAPEVSIESWEATFARIEKEDPLKYLKYKSTKPKDDRTVVIVEF